jgi:hypothetical protein
LEVEGHEGVELGFVGRVELRQAVLNPRTEVGERGKVATVEAFLLDELPDSLDEVQIGRVGRQEQQLDSPLFRVGGSTSVNRDGREGLNAKGLTREGSASILKDIAKHPERMAPDGPYGQVCHNPDCPDRGQAGRGNICVHRHKEQRYRCRTCERTFAVTMATPFYRLRTAQEVVTTVLILLCHGCPIQAIVAAFGFDERTVATGKPAAVTTAGGYMRGWCSRARWTFSMYRPMSCG